MNKAMGAHAVHEKSYLYYRLLIFPTKMTRQSWLLFLAVTAGCDSSIIIGGYKSIGTFQTRDLARNGAIKHIATRYNSLPSNRYYKVKYSVIDSPLTERSENAVWYHKGEAKLVFEADISSGPMCSWQEVSQAVLEQASQVTKAFTEIDSLAKPNQPLNQCK